MHAESFNERAAEQSVCLFADICMRRALTSVLRNRVYAYLLTYAWAEPAAEQRCMPLCVTHQSMLLNGLVFRHIKTCASIGSEYRQCIIELQQSCNRAATAGYGIYLRIDDHIALWLPVFRIQCATLLPHLPHANVSIRIASSAHA